MAEQPVRGEDFFAALRRRGFDFFSGVPCSLFGNLYPVLEAQGEVPLIASVREDDAVGQAAGAYLAGRKPVVLMQNSGLGNSLNAICSLHQIYKMPFLLVMSWRGFEGKDAPEHLVMGRAMTGILESIGLPYQILDGAVLAEQLDRVESDFQRALPTVLIVKKGVLT